ncbi:hypothetical protein DTO012A7_9703 [Penicillium roqueforti]|nr:hypothetical protein DTO012A7_9703 [Penicillium roqueforti]
MTVILDLDLHAIWQECSGIPTPPPCLATDSENSRQIPSDEGEPAGDETSGSSVIECLFHPTYEKLSAFRWTGPDPLSMSTQASDLFLYMSAFAFSNEVHWVETRLVLFDRKPGESIGEHLFFLPRVETALGNLSGNSFRLSLRPRMELLQYSSQSTLSPLGTLPTTLSLDPEFFVHKILGGYK